MCVNLIPLVHGDCDWLMCTGLILCRPLIVGSISLFLSPRLTGAMTNRPAGQRETVLGGEEG